MLIMFRILVLDHGKVVEFGTPWELIQAEGPFRELVKQSGEENTLIEVCSRGFLLAMNLGVP